MQKLVTRRSFSRTGLPSGVVSTAATNGACRGAMAVLAAGAFSLRGVIQFDPSGQLFGGVTLHHYLRQLVLDLPGGGSRHAKAAAESISEIPCLLWVR